MKIRLVGAELCHTDVYTDRRDEVSSRFWNIESMDPWLRARPKTRISNRCCVGDHFHSCANIHDHNFRHIRIGLARLLVYCESQISDVVEANGGEVGASFPTEVKIVLLHFVYQ